MAENQLQRRTVQFALRIIRFVDSLPRGRAADVMGNQLLRAGTSVGANYRAACRAKSTADFLSKMGTVEEEADECIYWLEMLAGAEIVKDAAVSDLTAEGQEILAMVVASINTPRRGPRR